MKLLLTQNMFFVPTYGGEAKANRMMLEGLASLQHPCRAVVPAIGKQGPRDRDQFLEALAARGICLSASSGGVDVFSYNGVEVHAITDSAQLPAYLMRQIDEFDPTWVLVGSADPGQVLLEAALRASPARVVYLAHTMLMFPFGPRCFIPDPAKTELLRQVAGIITVSRYVQSYIRQWAEADSVVIPWPVYGSGPFPHYGDVDAGLVTLINPCGYKGISIFLALARKFPDVEFAAVLAWGATQSDRAALEQLPNIRLLLPVDAIDEVFAQTRVLLAPSLWAEGFPLVPVEAMLRGIPVLAGNSGGLPEAKLGVDYVLPVNEIERYEGRTDDQGLPIPVIPEQDTGPWEAALRELLTDRRQYNRLSHASREAATAFVAKVGVEPFEHFLEQLRPGPQLGRQAARVPSQAGGAGEHGTRAALSKLSPEELELLALRLRRAKDRGDGNLPPRSTSER